MSDQEFKLKNVLEKDQIKALLKAHTKKPAPRKSYRLGNYGWTIQKTIR